MKWVVTALLCSTLAACSGGPRPAMSTERIGRVLATAPGEAQPSKVVATEIAFARAARDSGQWTAFREFAATGAVIHGRNGVIEAEPWLAVQDDPEKAVQWAPRAIWMSCDSLLAVSLGRFRDPEGLVGSFVTVWLRQDDGRYRWIYDTAAPDNPQPPPDDDAPEDQNIIVVTGLDSVEGHVADCIRDDVQAPPARGINDATQFTIQNSPDGTLQWRWAHFDDGSKRVIVHLFSEGEWREGFDQHWPAPARVK